MEGLGKLYRTRTVDAPTRPSSCSALTDMEVGSVLQGWFKGLGLRVSYGYILGYMRRDFFTDLCEGSMSSVGLL